MPVRPTAAQRHHACTRKERFHTRWAAFQVAFKQSVKSGGHIEPYRCPYCRKWHIGHPPRRAS